MKEAAPREDAAEEGVGGGGKWVGLLGKPEMRKGEDCYKREEEEEEEDRVRFIFCLWFYRHFRLSGETDFAWFSSFSLTFSSTTFLSTSFILLFIHLYYVLINYRLNTFKIIS